MENSIDKNQWLWVIVQNPEGNEHFLGQLDEKDNVSFIVTFFKKEEAIEYLEGFSPKDGSKYEVQAVQYQDLARDAVASDFKIYFLNGSGEITDKISPEN